MANYAPPQPARRSRRWGWIVLAVVTLVIGLILGRYVLAGSTSANAPTSTSTSPTTSQSAGLAAPHGPRSIAQGVPTGYTDDQAGAATAAVNATQLRVALAHGQATPATAARLWLASTADATTRQAFSQGSDGSSGDQTNKLPAATRVTSFSPTATTVQVWVVSAGSAPALGGGDVVSAAWTTETYQLVWQAGDWKVASVQTSQGPQPGDTTTQTVPALTNGLYSFYLN
jgi:hypothetical protein